MTGHATLPFADELRGFAAEARRFLEDHSPSAAVRAQMETDAGFDPDLWKQIAALGWCGMAIPEEHGGTGSGFAELCALTEEMGRVLLCAPYLSSVVLAGQAILAAGTPDDHRRLLPGIADGSARATLALTEPSGRWDVGAIETRAERDGEVWRIGGRKSFVLDGHTATLLLVAARTDGGVSLLAVDPDAAGVTRVRLDTLDMTRKMATVDLDGAPGTLVGAEGRAWPALERTLDLGAVALAAECVGGAQRCLDMSSAYAKSRVQFGRPIGQFQAVKHRCADMLIAVESARSAAWYAAWAASEPGELPVAACMAKSYCCEAFVQAAGDTIQIHGGIGFTWEHDAHLYFRRAKSSELLLGSPAYHREMLVQRLGV